MTSEHEHAILIVDDEQSVLNALRRTFRGLYKIYHASNAFDALSIFKENHEEISLIITDQRMPRMTGIELLKKSIKIKPETIKIMLTAYTEISDIIDSINQCDLYRYITKPWEDSDLKLTIKRGLESYEATQSIKEKNLELEELNGELRHINKNLNKIVDDKTKELKIVNKELAQLAITDPLTGINNRRYFKDRFKKEFSRAHRYSHPLSLVMIDIDYFKKYNDTHGHVIGDLALKKMANIFFSNARTSDFVSRYGGEEFVLALPETNKDGAIEICERIRKNVEDHLFPHADKKKKSRLTISLGIASFPDDATDSTQLIKKADSALYEAKHGGRNKVVSS